MAEQTTCITDENQGSEITKTSSPTTTGTSSTALTENKLSFSINRILSIPPISSTINSDKTQTPPPTTRPTSESHHHRDAERYYITESDKSDAAEFHCINYSKLYSAAAAAFSAASAAVAVSAASSGCNDGQIIDGITTVAAGSGASLDGGVDPATGQCNGAGVIRVPAHRPMPAAALAFQGMFPWMESRRLARDRLTG